MSLYEDGDRPRKRVNGRYGANKIHKNKGVNPTELLTRIWEKNPEDDEGIYEKFLAHVTKVQSYIPGVVEYFVTNGLRNIRARDNDRPRPPRPRPTPAEITDRTARVDQVATILRCALLDMVCPNGKAVRENTGTYVGNLGGHLAVIGRAAGKRVVGEALTDAEAAKLIAK